MGANKPLQITFAESESGLSIGWGMSRENLDPSRLPVLDEAELRVRAQSGKKVSEIAHEEATSFFNGPLSADLNIPNNYPYELVVREGNEVKVIASGNLRPRA